ncbi:MAG: M23 family metallopeptidase [Sarcina sp.]
MGMYDDAYKSYYNRINNKSKNSKVCEERNSLNIDMEEEFLIKKSKNKISFFDSYFNIIIVSTLIPTVMFMGIVALKYVPGKIGKEVYNHVKKAVSTDLLYKEYALNFINNFDIDSLLKKEKLNDLGVEMPKKEAEDVAANGGISSDKEIKSFNLDNNSIKFTEGKTEYKDLLESLKGSKLKAKSEEGIVLSCSYKIIVNHIAGVIENVGENASGYYLSIKHDNGIVTNYYNLPELKLEKGSSIRKGDTIADIKEKQDIIFKIKEDNKFIHPRMYLDFLE